MKTLPIFLFLLLVLAAGAWGQAAVTPTTTNALTAEELVSRVIESRRTSGFRMRAALTFVAPDTKRRETRQLLIEGRRDGETVRVLYACLWPAALKDHMFRLDRTSDRCDGVYRFEPPDTLTLLKPEEIGEPFFGSDFSIEDMLEDYWRWPATLGEGETNLLGRACRRVEFRAPTNAVAACSAVRVWIAPAIALPLLTEKLNADGQVVKRIRVEKIANLPRHCWAAAIVSAETPGRQTRSTLTAQRGERDLVLPERDFTHDGMRERAAKRPDKEPESDKPSPDASGASGD